MPGDSILDHPDLRALDEIERREAEKAFDDPEERGRLMLRTVLALKAEAKQAREHCRQECLPAIEEHFRLHSGQIASLRRFRAWLVGIGVGLGAIGLIVAIVELVR